MNPLALAAFIGFSSSALAAREVGWYSFAPGDPPDRVADHSGFGNDGAVRTADAGPTGLSGLRGGEGLHCGGKAYVQLPSGASIWGAEAVRGAISIWVKPDFAPEDLANGLWEGYAMVFYAMETDGNGLPDGDNEIGLWCHGGSLYAKLASSSYGASFSIKSPLRKGEWSHLAFCWTPGTKALYVDGKLADRDDSPNKPTLLDGFPAMIGQHASSKGWAWQGDLADCRLYDDALTDAEVAALAAGPPHPDPLPLGGGEGERPATSILKADFGEVWMGDREVAVSLAQPVPEGLEALCEVVGDHGREAFPAVAARAQMRVPYGIRREGWSRVNLLVRERAGGRVVAARSAYANVPLLAPTLAQIQTRLDAISRTIQAPGLPQVAREALRPRFQELQAHMGALRGDAMARPGREKWEALRAAATEDLGKAQTLSTLAAIYARGAREGQLPEFGVGVDCSLRKVLKHDPFQGTLEAGVELRAARREHEAAQVFVFALDKALEGVEVTTSDLKGPAGAAISRENVTWNQVGYVQTLKPTYEVRHIGMWPDPLLPPAPFNVAKGDFEAVWLTVRVPADAVPGDYTGTLTLAPANAAAREVAVKLHVWNYALPENPCLTTAFGLNCMGSFASSMDVDKYAQNAWEHRISLGFPGSVTASATPVYPSFDLGGKTLAFRARVAASLRDAQGPASPLFLICTTAGVAAERVHGPLPVKPGEWSDCSVTFPAEERPTSLRFEWREAGPASITLSPLALDGRVWDVMDKPEWWPAGGPWARVSAAPEGLCLEVAAPTPGEAMITRWPCIERSAVDTPAEVPFHLDFAEFDKRVERYLYKGINAIFIPVPGCPRHTSEAEARELVRRNYLGPIAKAYQDHLREKGWLDLAYTYVSDEPEREDYPALNAVQGTIKEWAPDLRNMLTARSFPETLKYVDIWCPEVYSFDPKGAAEEQAKGKRVWWYPAFSTRHPFPDFWVDYPATDCRVIFWLTWKHKLDGLLYWSITNYSVAHGGHADPWVDAMTFPGANGDGTLVYPGKDGGPVNSTRWECIRDGSEDYDLFVLLRDAVARVRALSRAEDAQTRALVGRAEALLAIEDGVAKSWREWTEDPAPLLAARDEMGELIEGLLEVAK